MNQQVIDFFAQHNDTIGNALFWMPDVLKAKLTVEQIAALKAKHFFEARRAVEVLA
jgi:hypothetical protein